MSALTGGGGIEGQLLTVSRPTEIEPTNFSVDTVLVAISSSGAS
jgi:hypothetical protein